MLEMSVRSNVKAFKRGMSRIEKKQLPFATALALTKTAGEGKDNTIKRLPRVFDRPTPFTTRGVAIKPATKHNLVATVFFKDIQAQYLWFEEEGGIRYPARRALVMPVNVPLNKYGNMTRRKVQQLLARKNTFVGTVKGIGGIWQRNKSGLKLLVRFHRQAKYKKRLGFAIGVQKTAAARFDHHLAKAMRRAVDGAK